MKRFFAVLMAAALFISVVAVAPALAHCGRVHEGEGKIYVAQLSHDDLVFELKVAETDPDVAALERAIEVQEEMETKERIDRLVRDLMIRNSGRMEFENFRVENGKFHSIPPANIQLK